MSHRTWLAIICGMFIVAVSLGIRQAFGVFARPMALDLDVSRQVFALAMAVQQLMWGVGQPFAGAVADRFGAGRAIVAASIVYVAGLWVMATTDSATGLLIGLGILVGLGLAGTTFAVV